MNTQPPVRVLSANLHTTSDPRVVVPWLWAMAVRHRIHAMTLQEVTPAHARVLRARPGWVLVKHPDTQEALYARRRMVTDRRVIRMLDTSWARHRLEGEHPGRSLPYATLRGWLAVASIHFPPGWTLGWADRQAAGLAYLTELEDNLPVSCPLYLDGDWNALPSVVQLAQLRRRLGLSRVYGHRIVHATVRDCRSTPWTNIGRVKGMDHDAHVAEVSPR